MDGSTVIDIQKTAISFAGNPTTCIKVDKVLTTGVHCFLYQVFKKAGRYMDVVSIIASSKEEAEKIISFLLQYNNDIF